MVNSQPGMPPRGVPMCRSTCISRSCAVNGQLLQHGLGLVRCLSDVLPHTEKVDRGGVLEALPGLDHRAHGPDPYAVDVPCIVLPARARAMAFHTRRTVEELGFDTAA